MRGNTLDARADYQARQDAYASPSNTPFTVGPDLSMM
jgi:hypothetical protein